MVTNDRSPGRADATVPAPDAAIGIAHPTVVPANFDPDGADERRERSERR